MAYTTSATAHTLKLISPSYKLLKTPVNIQHTRGSVAMQLVSFIRHITSYSSLYICCNQWISVFLNVPSLFPTPETHPGVIMTW